MDYGFPSDDHYPRPADEKLFVCNHAAGRDEPCTATFANRREFAEHVCATGHNMLSHRAEGTDVAVTHVPDFLVHAVRECLTRTAGGQRPEIRALSAIVDPRERQGRHFAVDGYRVKYPRYQCADCKLVTFTWDQLVSHMLMKKHCLMLCTQCGDRLDWDPDAPNAPLAHARAKLAEYEESEGKEARPALHVGVRGVFRTKDDFVASDDPFRKPRTQFTLGGGKDIISYTHRLFHAYGKELESPTTFVQSPSGAAHVATCIKCRECRKAPLYESCVHLLKTGHQAWVLKHYPPELAVTPRQMLDRKPAPVLMYQCPTCFALRRTWGALVAHMNAQWHGSVACSVCRRRIPAGSVREHFTDSECARQNAYHCGGELQTPHRCLTAVDVTEARVVELIDEPDEVIDPCYAQDLNCRIVTQCPLETCMRAYGIPSMSKAHMHASKHGVYTCPEDACQEQLLVWEPSYAAHAHPIDLPANSHLRGKTRMADFNAMFLDGDLLRMFPNNFSRCTECDMVVDQSNAEQRHYVAECQLRQALRGLNVRETIRGLATEADAPRVLLSRRAVNDHLKNTISASGSKAETPTA
uniref:C2H2-type domain-containing protein n=1 Tax=Neobodo designis TaxID=312471 RepID=A0A7S1QX03_NEODS|mmetsp:Transcript_53893/g.165840  ORF Transcript_53893/g.165840 Transcript_53893/m.165840 type:complete len:583 (+) Transcript_53893:144-1892(+)